MKLSPEWLKYPELQEACRVLEQHNFEAYAVGGCVRDAIAEVPCNDIDIATNAPPHKLLQMFKWFGFKTYPTGIDHGTVTICKGDQSFEVTTFRHDVSTDGRRATVEYAGTMEEDAQRRDFTMNALYMDRGGNVFDPTGTGIDDILEGAVRFVGDAEQRCREDYLRIMRLFRFHAKYGCDELQPDAANAARKHKYALPNAVSRERVWSELKKILDLPEPFQAIAEMDQLGVLQEILPNADVKALQAIQMAEHTNLFPASWTRRFFALHGTKIPFPHANSEQQHLEKIAESLDMQYPIAVCTHLYGRLVAQDAHVLQKGCGGWSHREAVRGESAQFPVRAADLMQLGFTPGLEMGRVLRTTKEIWIKTGLTAKKDELLEMVIHA